MHLVLTALLACGADEPVAPPHAIGGDPIGEADPPVSAEQADAIYEAAMAAVKGRAPTRETVTVDGAEVHLYQWEDPRLILSEPCVTNDAPGACQALDGLRALPSRTVEIGPGNPSSYYCAPAGGEPVTAVGADGGQSGLCRFPDGSMVATWSLVYVPNFGRQALANKP